MTGTELREFRKQHGQTRSELAERLGVTESAVAKWEQGTNAIPSAVEKLINSPNRLEFDMETLNGIHRYANETGKSFSEAIIDLIKLGLKLLVFALFLPAALLEDPSTVRLCDVSNCALTSETR